MNKYEAMFIIKPDLPEDEKKNLFAQLNDVVANNNGKVTSANIWAEKRKLNFTINKFQDGLYYLLNFTVNSDAIIKIRYAYKLNENILRVLITKVEK